MSLVSKEHWDFWMGEMPMPKDCNYDVMWAMYDIVQRIQDKQYAAEQIHFYERLWRKWFPKYQENKSNETLKDIMKTIKENIQMFRQELTE